MYKNYFKYSEEIYLVNLEEGYYRIKGSRERIYTKFEILQELQRSQWREEKNGKSYYEHTLSYNNEDDDGIPFYEYLSDSSFITPGVYLQKEAVSEIIKKAFDTLPKKKKTILILYYFHKYNDSEIAQMIDSTQQVVHYNRHAALKKLAQNLQLKELYENDF